MSSGREMALIKYISASTVSVGVRLVRDSKLVTKLMPADAETAGASRVKAFFKGGNTIIHDYLTEDGQAEDARQVVHDVGVLKRKTSIDVGDLVTELYHCHLLGVCNSTQQNIDVTSLGLRYVYDDSVSQHEQAKNVFDLVSGFVANCVEEHVTADGSQLSFSVGILKGNSCTSTVRNYSAECVEILRKQTARAFDDKQKLDMVVKTLVFSLRVSHH